MKTETLQLEPGKRYHLCRGSFGEWGHYIGRGENGACKFAFFAGNEQDCLAVIEIPEKDMMPDEKGGFELNKNLKAYPINYSQGNSDEFERLMGIIYGDQKVGAQTKAV